MFVPLLVQDLEAVETTTSTIFESYEMLTRSDYSPVQLGVQACTKVGPGRCDKFTVNLVRRSACAHACVPHSMQHRWHIHAASSSTLGTQRKFARKYAESLHSAACKLDVLVTGRTFAFTNLSQCISPPTPAPVRDHTKCFTKLV